MEHLLAHLQKPNLIILVNRGLSMFLGGGEVIDLQLAQEFKQRGYTVEFLTSKPLFQEPRLGPPNGFATHFIRTPWLYDVSQWLSALPFVSRFKLAALVRISDEILFQCNAYFWLRRRRANAVGVLTCALPLLGLLLERISKVPSITFLHGPPSPIWKPLCARLRLLLCAGTTLGHFPEMGARVLRADPRIDKSAFRRLGDQASHKAKLGILANTFVVLSVGRLVSFKGLRAGMVEFKRFCTAEPDAIWLILGDGPLRQTLAEDIKRHNLEANIRLVGPVSRDDLPAYYAAADVTFIPSLYESFSIVALESMACEVPILARRAGYLPTLLGESGAGVLYHDEQTAEQRFMDLHRSPELRSNLASSGGSFIASRDLTSWTNIVEQMERHLLNAQRA